MKLLYHHIAEFFVIEEAFWLFPFNFNIEQHISLSDRDTNRIFTIKISGVVSFCSFASIQTSRQNFLWRIKVMRIYFQLHKSNDTIENKKHTLKHLDFDDAKLRAHLTKNKLNNFLQYIIIIDSIQSLTKPKFVAISWIKGIFQFSMFFSFTTIATMRTFNFNLFQVP